MNIHLLLFIYITTNNNPNTTIRQYNRYWAVTNIDYIHSRTSNRVLMMIFFVWVSAVIVSLAPQFGWKDPEYLQRIEQQKCMVSQDIGYQVCMGSNKYKWYALLLNDFKLGKFWWTQIWLTDWMNWCDRTLLTDLGLVEKATEGYSVCHWKIV